MSLQVCGLHLSHTIYYWLALYLRAWLFLYKSKFKKTNTQTPTKFARNWPAMWWYDSHLRHERGGHYTQHRFLWTSFIIEWMNRWKQRKSSNKIWAISSHLSKQQQTNMADRRRIASRAYIQWMIICTLQQIPQARLQERKYASASGTNATFQRRTGRKINK